MMSVNENNAFFNGFCNWKKALDSGKGFKQHESSIGHVQATAKYTEITTRYNTNKSINNLLETSRVQQVKRNRERLSKIASTVLLCARQMIALRGHIEKET